MPQEMKDGLKYYKVSEMAEILRVSVPAIRARIKAGVYPSAFKTGKSWLIPEDELMNSIDVRYGSGRK